MRLQKLSGKLPSLTSGCMGFVLDLYYRLVETICPTYLEQWTMSSLTWKFLSFYNPVIFFVVAETSV